MIPELFAPDLPAACRQVLLVTSPHETSVPAELRLLERADGDWHQAGQGIPVSLGRSGLAWGLGEHRASPPSGFRIKQEGDGCAPAGIFRLPFAFGDAPTASLKLPYIPITEFLLAVDDPRSRYYNQVIDSSQVEEKDWASTEFMQREDNLYRWGIAVGHNPQNQPGAGSCIFIHLWRGPGRPTAGCTAMSEENILRVLQWLDPALEPRLVQWIGLK